MSFIQFVGQYRKINAVMTRAFMAFVSDEISKIIVFKVYKQVKTENFQKKFNVKQDTREFDSSHESWKLHISEIIFLLLDRMLFLPTQSMAFRLWIFRLRLILALANLSQFFHLFLLFSEGRANETSNIK